MRIRRMAAVVAVATAVLPTSVMVANAQGTGAAITARQAIGGPVLARPGTAPAAGSVVVKDITIWVPHQQPVSAYLVKQSGRLPRKSSAGILFLHWLGQIHNDRSEYLAEAIELANQGVVSVLPQGYFPWVPDPDGTTDDVRS